MPEIEATAKITHARDMTNEYFDDLQSQLLEIIKQHYASGQRYSSRPTVKVDNKKYQVFSQYSEEQTMNLPYVSFPSAEELKKGIIDHLNTAHNRYAFGKPYPLFSVGFTPEWFQQGVNKINSTKSKEAAKELQFELSTSGLTYLFNSDEGPKIRRLIKRLEAVKELKNTLENVSEDQVAQAAIKKAVTTCKQNEPQWSERPFLKKLGDIFTAGLTYFFSTNSTERFVKTIKEEQNSSPKPSK